MIKISSPSNSAKFPLSSVSEDFSSQKPLSNDENQSVSWMGRSASYVKGAFKGLGNLSYRVYDFIRSTLFQNKPSEVEKKTSKIKHKKMHSFDPVAEAAETQKIKDKKAKELAEAEQKAKNKKAKTKEEPTSDEKMAALLQAQFDLESNENAGNLSSDNEMAKQLQMLLNQPSEAAGDADLAKQLQKEEMEKN